MTEVQDVGGALFDSVFKPEIRPLIAEYAEAGLDVVLESELLAAIPIVGTVRALAHGARGFREAFLTRKLIALLRTVGDPDPESLERWRTRVATEEGLRETGELVLAVVDGAGSLLKAELVGRALRAFLDGKCDVRVLRRTVEMVGSAITEDLLDLVRPDLLDPGELYEGKQRRLLAIGLLADQSAHLSLESSLPPRFSREALVVREGA